MLDEIVTIMHKFCLVVPWLILGRGPGHARLQSEPLLKSITEPKRRRLQQRRRIKAPDTSFFCLNEA